MRDGRSAHPRRRRSSRCVKLALFVGASSAGVGIGGCGLFNDATTAATAPLSALPQTDVAVETNLETSLTAVEVLAAAGGGSSSEALAGTGLVSGPSSSPSETSYFSPGPGEAVLAALNDVTRDCLGIVHLATAASTPILGESAAGTYYFDEPSTAPGGCDASLFAVAASVPGGWPAGDPSSAGFPVS